MKFRKIPIYKVRTFSEKLSDSVDFTMQNSKVLFRICLYLVLPLCLLSGISAQIFWDGYLNLIQARGVETSWWVNYGVYILSAVFIGLVMMSIVYAMMAIDAERKDGIADLTIKEMWPLLRRNLGRSCILLLMWILFYVLMVGIVVLMALGSAWTLLLTIPALFVAVVPLLMIPPVYLLEEDTNIFAAIGKAYRYGIKTWGGIVGVLLVIGLILNIISSVVMLPMVALIFTKGQLFPTSFSSDLDVTSLLLSLVTYLMVVVATFLSYFVSSLSFVALAYQYGHAADKLDGISVGKDIERFEELADTNEDVPDLINDPIDINNFDRL